MAHMGMKERIARALWACDQDSVETPFDKLPVSPRLDNLFDMADEVLEAMQDATPFMVEQADALKGWDEYALRDDPDDQTRQLWTRMVQAARHEDDELAPASADTRPEGGDSTQIEAPFTSGAVPEGQTPTL